MAFMPPEQDCSCGPDDCEHLDRMLEAFPDKEDMLLGTACDPDGYRKSQLVESCVTFRIKRLHIDRPDCQIEKAEGLKETRWANGPSVNQPII